MCGRYGVEDGRGRSSARPGHAAPPPPPHRPPTPTQPPPALPPGTCLTSFTLGPVLGTGSFGRVTLAKHVATGAVVALKALSKAHLIRNQQAQ